MQLTCRPGACEHRADERRTGGADYRPDAAVVEHTCSAGLTEFRRGEKADHAIERADQALCRAKRDGRNRTVLD